MNLDIFSVVQTAFYIFIVAAILSVWVGVRTIRSGQRLLFFRKRQQLIRRGQRLIFFAVLYAVGAFLMNRYAEPVIYEVFPPSPTVTNTATMTATHTITPTATITQTPSITPTTSITPTPFIPTEIFAQFTATVTANPNAIFSRPQFSREINQKNFQAIDVAKEFANPITKLYATFSFDKMNSGAQWTVLWVRVADKVLVCAETEPWKGGTGGYGYAECQPSADSWQAGDYEFHMFIGKEYFLTARFSVTGNPPTGTPTQTVTPSKTFTLTSTTTYTPTPTWTPVPTWTPTITWTPVPSWTPVPIPPTATRAPTQTVTVVDTPTP